MKNHKVRFYIFVKRQVISDLDEVSVVHVIRIYCEINYKLRIETKEPLQYTLTVLPAFLIPHGRVQVNLVLQSFNMYVNKELKNQHIAALHIGCDSRHSFRLYYQRIMSRLDIWSSLFEKKGEAELVYLPVGKKWEKIQHGLKDWPDPMLIDHWAAYGHAILSHKKMGLGP